MKLERADLTHIVVMVALAALAVGTAHAEPRGERLHEIINMVRQDCGSCHGMTLKGGLGPALVPDAIADKPDDSLVATIMNGRPGTAMPGWSRLMSEPEAEWIVSRLKAGFPQVAQAEGAQ